MRRKRWKFFSVSTVFTKTLANYDNRLINLAVNIVRIAIFSVKSFFNAITALNAKYGESYKSSTLIIRFCSSFQRSKLDPVEGF